MVGLLAHMPNKEKEEKVCGFVGISLNSSYHLASQKTSHPRHMSAVHLHIVSLVLTPSSSHASAAHRHAIAGRATRLAIMRISISCFAISLHPDPLPPLSLPLVFSFTNNSW